MIHTSIPQPAASHTPTTTTPLLELVRFLAELAKQSDFNDRLSHQGQKVGHD